MHSIIKNSIFALVGCAGALAMTGCNDGFMDRFPETSITEKVFFSTPSDLETYTNGLYGYLGAGYDDIGTDNMIYGDNTTIYRMMRDEITERNIGQWSWGDIRTINFMLARVGQVKGDPAEIAHWVGLGRMFRAIRYYGKVKSYSDVPWYNHDLATNETEELYKTQDPRALVVDSIMADLEYATQNMKDLTSTTVIGRNIALAVQARIALHEGTFRKYHPELGLSDGDRFLTIAANACRKIMDSGRFSISKEIYQGCGPYLSLFCNENLTANPEMVMVSDYDYTLGRKHNAHANFDYNFGLTRSLMEDYLCIKDGKAVPFHTIDGAETKTFPEIFKNRDPRLAQTFMAPGYIDAGKNEAHRVKQNLGGYAMIKFRPLVYEQCSWGESAQDLPVIRYAEVLLMYAEAKAELGTLTQDDVDQTVNAIRDRVGMPHASLAEWLANVDPVQDARYSNVSSSQKGAVLEVRRERRIELVAEGFRYDDLMRWGMGKLFAELNQGAYIPGPGYYDVTGDGVPDIAFAVTKADADKIPEADKNKYKLTVYTLEGNTIGLTEGDHGYIYLVAQKDRFNFREPKYYYTPLSDQDILINENLKQNPYWK